MKVIQMSTQSRLNESKELFEQVKPLLDQGFSYAGAVRKLKSLPKTYSVANMAWYKDMVEYGETQGYSQADYRRNKKNGMC